MSVQREFSPLAGRYGEIGIFDPAKLASIDFLNQPELLVKLVSQSAGRDSRKFKLEMIKMTEVTQKWMEYMIARSFPPLTPHHTQAFTVRYQESGLRTRHPSLQTPSESRF